MKVLLDTHIILWFLTNDPKLSEEAKDIILDDDNEIYYSSAAIWEVAIKHTKKPDKLRMSGDKLSAGCRQLGFKMIPIDDAHVCAMETLHRLSDSPDRNDPFDRIIIAQVKAERLTFVSHDSLLPYYDEPCIMSV